VKDTHGIVALISSIGQSEDNDWKEKEWREQQEILRKRRENFGYLSDEEKVAIRERRAKVGAEEKYLSKVQEGNDAGVDNLEAWKKLREEGKIKTANSGLVRDEDSSRLGSEGLFAERIDAKLPYIESGYVPEDTEEKGSGEPFGDLSKIFGKK